MQDPALPSNRKFGLFFAGVCCIAAVWFWRNSHETWTAVMAAAAILFALLALWAPKALATLNRGWYGFGMLLGRIVSPLVLGFLYFAVLTPVAWATRLAGRDELRLKKRDVDSYWVSRNPPGPAPDSFRNQF